MKIFTDENIEERYAQGLYEDYLKEQIEQKNKEIEKLTAESTEWESKCYQLQDIIKEIRNQLTYLETYSSKEDVFEDMKRRLDRIEKIIKENK